MKNAAADYASSFLHTDIGVIDDAGLALAVHRHDDGDTMTDEDKTAARRVWLALGVFWAALAGAAVLAWCGK